MVLEVVCISVCSNMCLLKDVWYKGTSCYENEVFFSFAVKHYQQEYFNEIWKLNKNISSSIKSGHSSCEIVVNS